MTEADPKANILGHFGVQGVNHAGALKLDGATTELQVYSEDFFHLKTEELACVRGVSNEGVSISALHCVPLTLSGSATYHGKHRHYMILRPNFLALGPRYLEPTERVLTSITFGFSDANNLFYDWGTFGSIFEDRISRLRVSSNTRTRRIRPDTSTLSCKGHTVTIRTSTARIATSISSCAPEACFTTTSTPCQGRKRRHSKPRIRPLRNIP